MIDVSKYTSTTMCVCCGGYVNDGWVCESCQEKYRKTTLNPVRVEQCISEMKQFLKEINELKRPPVSDTELMKADRNMALIEAYIAGRR